MRNSNERREWLSFSYDDGAALREYFENMAMQGWILREYDEGKGFLFSKEEPQKLTYAAEFFLKTKTFSNKLTPAMREYIGYCEAAGWTYILNANGIGIFVTKVENTLPIFTDDTEKKIIRRRLLISNALGYGIALPLLCCIIAFCYLNFQDAVVNDVLVFLFPLLVFSLFGVLAAGPASLITYLRQKARLSRGEKLRYQSLKSLRRRTMFYSLLYPLMMGVWGTAGVASLVHEGAYKRAAVTLIFLLVFMLIPLVIPLLRKYDRLRLRKNLAFFCAFCSIIALPRFAGYGVPVSKNINGHAVNRTGSILVAKTEFDLTSSGSDGNCRVEIIECAYEPFCRLYLRRDESFDPSGMPVSEPLWGAEEVLLCGDVKFVIYDDGIIELPDVPLTEEEVRQLKAYAGQ